METATTRQVSAKSARSSASSPLGFANNESIRLAPTNPRRPVSPLAPPPLAEPAVYVTIPLAASLTGYSAKAIRRKIESGVWVEGREIRRAPDGHVLVSMKGYRQWVERGRA